MKRRLALLGVAAAVATLSSPTAPAQAVLHDVCAGVTGTAQISSPFVYPVIGQTDDNPTPPFQVTASPHSATFTILFTTGICAPSQTQLSASGIVRGWCDLSVGTGMTPPGADFHWIGVGGFLVLTGEVSGVADVEPNRISGENCITGADNFLVSYVAVLTSCSVTVFHSVGADVSLPNHFVPTGLVDTYIHGSLHPRVSACV